MPQENDVRLTDKSFNPLFTNSTTSFFLEEGKINFGPPKSRRISQEKIISLGESVGLKIITRRNISENHYIVIFKKT